MRSVVALKNRAAEGATSVRDRWTSPSSAKMNIPDPYHARKVALNNAGATSSEQPEGNESDDTHIDWANLSREDKEIFFSWLDEFFARLHGSTQDDQDESRQELAAPPPAPRRPPVPRSGPSALSSGSRASNAPPIPPARRVISPAEDAAVQAVIKEPPPTPRISSGPPPPPSAPKPMRPLSEHQSGSAPPPVAWGNRPPTVNMANKPSRPSAAAPVQSAYNGDEEDGDEWCTAHRDFSAADEHAALFPRENARSIASLAYDLTSPFEDEVDKARVIFTWMHHNVAYDAKNFLAGTVKHGATADDTLRTGMAVCEGYSGLFSALALAAGLECISVHGHGKGFGYVPPPEGTHPSHLPPYAGNHAWNAVKLDGDWRLMDSTWGAGALNGTSYIKRFVPKFFCGATGPGHNVEFGRRHFPTDPAQQLVPSHLALSWEQYLLLPERPRIMGDFETLGYSETILEPASRVLAPGRHRFLLKRHCVHLPETEDGAYVPIVLLDGHPLHMFPLALQPYGWTIDVDISNASGQVFRLGVVKTIGDDDALGVGRAAYERAKGRKAMSFGYLCEWDVE